MPLPVTLQELINNLLAKVRKHPEHQLMPVERYKLYRMLESELQAYIPHPILGRLSIITAKFVLPIWQQAMPLHPNENPSEDESASYDNLPEYLLELAEGLLTGRVDIETAVRAAGDYWYVMGNIGEDELRPRGVASAIKAYYAGEASLMALNETLSGSMFDTIRGWESYTDDTLGYAHDSASAAVKAYSGTNPWTSVDFQKRLEFWEWWLTEALPIAWEASRIPAHIKILECLF